MPDWFLETGVYLLGAALIHGAGWALLCWGLWGDRSKGRVRCPRCWYDMRGTVPRLVCPECGHDAGSERQLCRDRRGWRRIVLGVLLLLVSSYPLLAVVGWVRERRAMAALHASGARPWLVDQPWATSFGPDRLVAQLPEGFARVFQRRRELTLSRQVPEAALAACGQFHYLERLTLHGGGRLTNAGLAHLGGLSNLRYLHISSVGITDTGLAHLKPLQRLEHFELNALQVTDAGLAHLEELPRLQRVWLISTAATDAGLTRLKQALPKARVRHTR